MMARTFSTPFVAVLSMLRRKLSEAVHTLALRWIVGMYSRYCECDAFSFVKVPRMRGTKIEFQKMF